MSPRLGIRYAADYDAACGVVLSRSLQSSEVGIGSPGFKSQLGEVTGYTACNLGPAHHPVFPQLDDLHLCISLDGKWGAPGSRGGRGRHCTFTPSGSWQTLPPEAMVTLTAGPAHC